MCGMCSGSHETQECLVKYMAKQDIVHRCPNCNQAHHAWNKFCPVRLRLVERDRERQSVWVANQQKTATISERPRYFCVGSATTHGSPTCPVPNTHRFSTSVSHRRGPAPATNHKLSRSTITKHNSFHSDDRPAFNHTLLTTHYLFTSTSPLHFLHPDTRHVSADFPFNDETRYYQLSEESFQAIGKKTSKRSLLNTCRCS